MRPRDRRKHKGRALTGTFSAVPHAVQDSQNWHRCGGTAIKLLLALVRQFNGRNNGDLGASMSILKRVGWRSPETISLALRELRHLGLITLTRQGGLHGPSLYALTWHPIHDCNGKLDCAPTRVASGDWRTPREAFKRPKRFRNANTDSEQPCHGFRSAEPESPA